MEQLKWVTPESSDGERTLKQHAFISAIRKRKYTLEEYPGNRALCSHRAGMMNENEEFEPFDKIEGEDQKENCCSLCRGIAAAMVPNPPKQ
jgi:hypothetical protein